jgi:hypothetical protein
MAIKLLRILEIFTSVSVSNKQIKKLVVQMANSKHIRILCDLLNLKVGHNAQVIFKIFKNMLQAGATTENWNNIDYEPGNLKQNELKTDFSNNKFLNF